MHTDFEERLSATLGTTADTFTPGDPSALVAAGHARGRAMRRRRTAAATAGVAAAAALAVCGATLGPAVLDRGGSGTTAAHRTGSTSYPSQRMDSILKDLLPKRYLVGIPREPWAPDFTGSLQLIEQTDAGAARSELKVVVRHSFVGMASLVGCTGHDEGPRLGYCRRTDVRGGMLTINWKPGTAGATRQTLSVTFDLGQWQVALSETPLTDSFITPSPNARDSLTDVELTAIATSPVWDEVGSALPRPTATWRV
ncbi:hypothetical protein [Streptomyces sp. NPDC021224]|uniref:hypothetical protein n=1 Tax=unclassified Streptomyces TaxID=2593676 RepID=UPI0037A34A19